MQQLNNVNCFMCGACCVAYSISTLKKENGVVCRFLKDDGKCGDYQNRPQVCRDFKADNLCVLISSLSFEEKVFVIKKVYVG